MRYSTIKRAADVALGAAGLILSLPFWPLVAVLIRMGSRGPVFYAQDRVGKDGKVFLLWKFRSMIQGAESNGAIWAEEDDARVTPVGRVLRRLHIDEVPQLANVLRGEMSIVGPRPERPEFIASLEQAIPRYRLRLAVKPGLTGWAQVKYQYASSLETSRVKLGYDLEYVDRMGFLMDLRIMLMTVKVIFKWRE
jgi:lipopolysaccharide/colanic/teichoic acid biosynthesis glycosyltransferase